jgi:hypothetical protein
LKTQGEGNEIRKIDLSRFRKTEGFRNKSLASTMTKVGFPKTLTPIEGGNPFLNSMLQKRNTIGGGTPSETASFTPKQTPISNKKPVSPKKPADISPKKPKEIKVPGLDLSKIDKGSEDNRIGTAISGVTAQTSILNAQMSSHKIEQSNNIKNLKKLDEYAAKNTIYSQGTDEDTLDEQVISPVEVKVEHQLNSF